MTDARFFRKYLDILSEQSSDEPKTREEIEARIKELDAQIKDLTPDLLPVTPSDEGDRITAYTTPKQQRDVLKNPDEYNWGTDKRKDPDFKRPLIKDPEDLAPRGYNDSSTPKGMPTDWLHSRKTALGIDPNDI
jgi:hypothetical protein